MEPISLGQLVAPARVVDVDLAEPYGVRQQMSVSGYNSLWCLYRFKGIPHSVGMWDVRSEVMVTVPTYVAASPARPPSEELAAAQDHSCGLTVIICTRDRPEPLMRTLRSLRQQADSDFELLVVENTPAPSSAAEAVSDARVPRCRYVHEPAAGLSRARNRGLAEVETDYVAWIDDDEVADRHWVQWLKRGFAHSSQPDAVCGLMLPGELETQAQVRFEQYGGFNKGRDLTPVVLAAHTPTVRSPLYPLPSFGAGGNMAFRVGPLLSLGGFDNHLGAGTRTHGGEETQVLARLLLHGRSVLHWPPAITWHTHRRSMAELERQFYGYSAGLSAFYMSMLIKEPGSAPEVLRLVPQGLRDLARHRRSGRTEDLPDDFPSNLLANSRHGLLSGAPLYVRELLGDARSAFARQRTGP